RVVELMPSFLLVMARFGAAVSMSVSVLASLLLGSAPLALSSLIVAVLTILSKPAAAGLMTCSINVVEPVAPPASVPIFRLRTPALLVQPGFSAATKEVPVGNGLVRITLVAA